MLQVDVLLVQRMNMEFHLVYVHLVLLVNGLHHRVL
jgi:hypothetical protein